MGRQARWPTSAPRSASIAPRGAIANAAADDRTQHPADHRAQGFLHDFIVRDQTVGRVVVHGWPES